MADKRLAKTERLNLRMNRIQAKRIERLQKRLDGATKSEVVFRAIVVLESFLNEQRKEGH